MQQFCICWSHTVSSSEVWPYYCLTAPAQRKVAEAIIRAWEERLPKLEPLCRMLLVADRCAC